MPGYSLNEGVLRQALRHIGHPEETRDLVRADIQFLADHGLLRIETMAMPSGDLWVCHLLDAGQEVADGRTHPGVARRKPQG